MRKEKTGSEELEGWPAGQKMFESPSVAAANGGASHPFIVSQRSCQHFTRAQLCQGPWAVQQVNKLPPFQGHGSWPGFDYTDASLFCFHPNFVLLWSFFPEWLPTLQSAAGQILCLVRCLFHFEQKKILNHFEGETYVEHQDKSRKISPQGWPARTWWENASWWFILIKEYKY